jgi:KaiC/GvpD/RAD55 family RecA-like ATPase
MKFNEAAFIYALASRPEDARKFATTFKPAWLNTAEYVPILAELFAFTREHGESPSIATLHTVFKDKDEEAYNLRYQGALDSITDVIPDRSTQIYTLGKARDTGVVRDFQELSADQGFLKKQADLEGGDVLKVLHTFFNKHGLQSEDRTMDVREAIDHLIDSHGFTPELIRVPCGIKTIDKWTGGGLRTKQLGIIMAPTGEGKSSMLVNMAHKMAALEARRVWLVTNELSLEEQTERVLSKITGVEVQKIIDDPGMGYTDELDRQWTQNDLHEKLRITEVNREVSVDDLESEMMKWVNLLGWKPDVLVLDFIERMRPCDSGYSRDRVWDWLGAISRDLSRFAKRHNILVWTAAQTNRSGFGRDPKKRDPLSLEMAQGSVKHLQEAASIIGMRQQEISDNEIVMEMVDLKQRFSKRSKRSVFLEVDLSRMQITNNEVEMDTCEVDEGPKKRAYTPEEKQAQRKEKAQRQADRM